MTAPTESVFITLAEHRRALTAQSRATSWRTWPALAALLAVTGTNGTPAWQIGACGLAALALVPAALPHKENR